MSDATVLPISIIAAIIPTLIYMGIIYWFDRYEKEPFWLLGSAFLWGAIPSIIIAFIFNSILSIPFYVFAGEVTGDALSAALVAPPVEETIKGIAVLGIFLFWRHEIDSLLDGIIYGAMVGMGFAMVENVYYFVNVFNEGGVEAWSMNVFLRAVIFGLNHALFTSMTGLGVAASRMSKNSLVKFGAPIAGWATAVFLHFLHNASVSFNEMLCFLALLFDWGGVFLIIAIIIGVLLQEKSWLKKYLAEEVDYGILTLKQFENACSGRKRGPHKMNTLLSRGYTPWRQVIHFYHHCSELAYKKHHYTLFQNEKDLERIQTLRGQISSLSQQVG